MSMPPHHQTSAGGEDSGRRLAELGRRNAELRDFAHLTAHDLKEPLSAIALFADVLATAHAQDLSPGGRRLLERVEAGVERMRLTIDTALARVDRSEVPFTGVDMGLVVADALQGLAASIETAGARVEVGPMPAVRGNRPELVRLVQNLVANSLRYVEGRPERTIALSARPRDERWSFEVADTGSGFSAEDERSGSGLGLGICREIAERHGGTIAIVSRPDAGATVTFTLPGDRSPEALPAAPADVRRASAGAPAL
jgi:signal transduction histidine kinase